MPVFMLIIYNLSGCLPYIDPHVEYERQSKVNEELKAKDIQNKYEVKLIATTDIGLPPDHIEKLLNKWGENNLIDPGSAVYSQISITWKGIYPPISVIDNPSEAAATKKMQKVVFKFRATINSKNSYGGYTGQQLYYFVIDNNEIIQGCALTDILYCLSHSDTATQESSSPQKL